MEGVVVVPGNCVFCGKPIKMRPARGGNNKSSSIFFCSECQKKIKEENNGL